MLVASYNIHRGRGPAGLLRPKRIAQVIAEIGADLIALLGEWHIGGMLIAPIAGALMSAATASTTAGATIASSSFSKYNL